MIQKKKKTNFKTRGAFLNIFIFLQVYTLSVHSVHFVHRSFVHWAGTNYFIGASIIYILQYTYLINT